ncbi:hypothetical protein [Cognatishimia sp. MH4019]|uniref:hypothetical protein n=1 Tax=Cognatishimia sp. MH4019 TaxID=2854030 RepID=UPI001CD6981D|nr:hypothetical protein [Cognatishimia sp. MH4019]
MIRSRFPHADERALDALHKGHHCFAELMARTHDLTVFEAREEVEDWLHILHISEFERSDVA